MEKSHWTGGQYSLYRVLFGGFLCLFFVGHAFGSGLELAGHLPLAFVMPFLDGSDLAAGVIMLLAAFTAALLAVGFWHRFAVYILILAYPWDGAGGLLLPELPPVIFLLLCHWFMPESPYGSWPARGRPDPAGDWQQPVYFGKIAWVFLIAAHLSAGVRNLMDSAWRDGSVLTHQLPAGWHANALTETLVAAPEHARWLAWLITGCCLLYVPLTLIRRTRPAAWLMLFLLHCSLPLLGAPLPAFAVVFVLLFAFDPGWLPPQPAKEPELVFYDGNCGLCHRTVRFLLVEDTVGNLFRMAPLQGELITQKLSETQRANLPDSVVLLTADGRLLVRSDAVVVLLQRLGGYWRCLGFLLALIPSFLRNGGYSIVASVRHHIFEKPADSCPILPPHLRDRFDY